jgi:hypothetical protein
MSENQVTETTTEIVETVRANKKALVAAGVTLVVAAAVGVFLKARARQNDLEVAVEETTVPVTVSSKKNNKES